jgi:hypothetical protein
MKASAGQTRSTPRVAGRLVGVSVGMALLLGAPGHARAGQAADEVAEGWQASAYAESLGGDAMSLIGLALIGVIAISRRHKTR